ncbi:hypothetical protein SLA2020_257770 [Shorea laevis]
MQEMVTCMFIKGKTTSEETQNMTAEAENRRRQQQTDLHTTPTLACLQDFYFPGRLNDCSLPATDSLVFYNKWSPLVLLKYPCIETGCCRCFRWQSQVSKDLNPARGRGGSDNITS